jgi:hypothetical protein
VRARTPILLLAVALAASAALVLSYDRHLTFLGDDWRVLTSRDGWSAHVLLKPFNEHLILLPTVAFKVLVELFGMGSALPFYLVSISLFLLCAVLLYVYLVPRVGEWAALVGAILVLFLGAAYEDLFWAFQMGFFGSVAAGLGALIALDREDDRGDRWACGLLFVSVACGGVGIAFVAAALADLGFGRRPRRRRTYVALLPLASYVVWRAVWGQTAGSQISVETVRGLPVYVFEAAASGTASLLGREAIDSHNNAPLLAALLLAVLLVVAAVRIGRTRELSRGLVVALALALSYWILIGLTRSGDGRLALSSRYQYPSAVFILIVASELLRDVRVPRVAAVVTALVTATAIVGGISVMNDHYRIRWSPAAVEIRLTTTALDIAGPSALPDKDVSFPPSVSIPAKRYLRAADRYGSLSYSVRELMERPEVERERVDDGLSDLLGIRLGTAVGGPRLRECKRVPPAGPGAGAQLGPGTVTIANTGSAAAEPLLRRFGTDFGVHLDPIPMGALRALEIPADRSSRRWRIAATAGTLGLCR